MAQTTSTKSFSIGTVILLLWRWRDWQLDIGVFDQRTLKHPLAGVFIYPSTAMYLRDLNPSTYGHELYRVPGLWFPIVRWLAARAVNKLSKGGTRGR